MSLYNTLTALAGRFQVDLAPASHLGAIIGFITAESNPYSLIIAADKAQVVEGVRDAEIVIRGTSEDFQQLFDPAALNRVKLLKSLSITPDVPWNVWTFQRFFKTFGLGYVGLESPERFEGTFPMPLRYPAIENSFRLRAYQPASIPAYNRNVLPDLIADDHPEWIATYHRAWEIGFKNLRQPEAESGFISNFIDTAFNDNTFMWDSCFMTMFGRYGRRLFNFSGTLDNFYAKQHDDGFICREISTYNGRDLFTPQDPRSTGPNIMAWTEWMDYQLSNDVNRLRDIFAPMVAHHRWWRDWRTWPDGSYWTSGWGSGMDNQSRVPHSEWHHRHYAWMDATMQQALNCQILLKIGAVIGRDEFNTELQSEYDHLYQYVNDRMWDESTGFYYDVAPDGKRSTIKSIGAYWGLLSDLISNNRAKRMIAHLDDPVQFKRPHRVPSQSADNADYRDDGGYWLGGVWAPTNYVVLRGLTTRGSDDLAYEIARNHVENVAKVFQDTGTLWENYAPEKATPGQPARPNFIGWTGISAINIPIEYLIGLRPQVEDGSLLWDIRLTERHGVLRYPFGQNLIDLICGARANDDDPPKLTVVAADAFRLRVRWKGGTREWTLTRGAHELQF